MQEKRQRWSSRKGVKEKKEIEEEGERRSGEGMEDR